MNWLNVLILILAAAIGAGGVAAYFKKGEGKATIELLKTQIDSYKDTEARHVSQITELQASLNSANKTISDQRNTIRDMTKAFKEYKDG